MRLILPNCRKHITGEDVDFISSVLCKREDEQAFLTKLLTDNDARDLILDNGKLVDAVQDRPEFIKISCYLYFYLLVRDGLRHKGISDRELADYVAEILAEYTIATRATRPLPQGKLRSKYIVDMLAALRSSNGQERFMIRTHIGNFSLFMAGLFPQRILYRQQHQGAPGLDYYEQVGSSSFELASHLHLAREMEMAPLLEKLGSGFHKIREALNDIRNRLMFIEPPASPVDLLPAHV